jgi:hypothetical protein
MFWTLKSNSPFSAPRDDAARAGCGNRAKSNFLARPATMPRARAAETEQKAISYQSLDHLPQQVAFLVYAHQRPTVNLALDFRDAPLHIGAVVQLVAHRPRISDVRAKFGVGSLAVHALGNEPGKSFVEAVLEAWHWLCGKIAPEE